MLGKNFENLRNTKIKILADTYLKNKNIKFEITIKNDFYSKMFIKNLL